MRWWNIINRSFFKEDLNIIGVVISGDTKTLKALKNKNYIKGATLGAVADKY